MAVADSDSDRNNNIDRGTVPKGHEEERNEEESTTQATESQSCIGSPSDNIGTDETGRKDERHDADWQTALAERGPQQTPDITTLESPSDARERIIQQYTRKNREGTRRHAEAQIQRMTQARRNGRQFKLGGEAVIQEEYDEAGERWRFIRNI